MNRNRVELAVSATLTATLVIIAGLALRREFFPATHVDVFGPAPTFEAAWVELLSKGTVVGDPSAPIKVIIFSDLQCPGCRAEHEQLRSVRAKYGSEVAIVFVHYPLAYHKFARQAARAADCAGSSGRFEEFVDAVYVKQDSIGLRAWDAYARDAGVKDLAQFGRCASDSTPLASIDDGLKAGADLKVTGTPTVIVNGWRFRGTPRRESLFRVIEDLRRGGTPAASWPKRAE